MTNSYSSAGSDFGLLPPARRLPEAIRILPSPNSPLLLSIKTTFAPCSVARTAAVNPAKPAPTTRTSEFVLSMVQSLSGQLLAVSEGKHPSTDSGQTFYEACQAPVCFFQAAWRIC